MSQPSYYSLNDYTDSNEQLLKAMGFDNEKEIKQALCISNNDINEAVAILTNEKLPKIPTLVNNLNNDIDNDIDMLDANSSQSEKNNPKNSPSDDPLKFPYDALLQLENNVFTDNWSIPYKKDEWLDRLQVSTIALLKEGLAELDPSCKKFLDRVLPEVYRKLHDSSPVKNWANEVQQGVYNMTLSALEIIAIRIGQEGVPEVLLNTLALIFNPDTTFHNKNVHRLSDRSYFDSFESVNTMYSKNIETHGWLIDFINIFGIHKGYETIKNQLEKSNDINEFNLLLKPLAACSAYLNEQIFLTYYENSIRRIYEFIKGFADDDFKDKNVGRVFDLIHTIKKLCTNIWTDVVEEFNTLHLTTVLNMLKYSHYNSKMNSLKEICKLIDNVNSISLTKVMIDEEKLSEWIITEKVLSYAVEGNIDQSQYCDKVKTIVEFIGDRIKSEEISVLWEMQYNKPMPIIDNLYNIIGIAATRFNSEQLDYLLVQIIQTWNNSSFKLHDKLVNLLKIIGREAKSNKTCSRILEALWELRNRPGLNRQLLFLIYSEHLHVLSGGRLPREAAKREYLKRCCEDIKKSPGSSIAIASLKHMYEILNSYQKNSSKALKDALTDLVVPIMKNLCLSLLKCHSNAYEKAKLSNQKFDQTALIDDLFTHEEVVQTHLNAMKFILQEGNLYLNLNRAQDIWNTLITNEHSCDWDKKIGFEWFIDCWSDLNDDSRAEIFKKQILNLKPSKLSLKGYECFKLYFIRVNDHESKIQTKNDIDNFTVEKLDLIGLNYLWDIILFVDDEAIADLATKFLLEISFEKVSFKLKRDLTSLHQRFIKECYSRLENCLITLDSSPIGQLLLNAFKISYLSVSMTEMESVPIASRFETLKCIERLLMIAERYIVKVEETQSIGRTNLPHFLTFKSESFPLTVVSESPKQSFDLYVCSNDTLGDLRLKISNSLGVLSNNLQIYYNDKLLNVLLDSKLLAQLNIDGMTSVMIKTAATYPSSLNQTPVKDSSISFQLRQDPDVEKSLPGVIVANSNSGSAFEMLYRLEDLNEPKINSRVRNILKLIPTNPRLLESFDQIVGKLSHTSSSMSMNSSMTASASASASVNELVKSPSVSTLTSNLASASSSISQQLQKQLTSQSTPTTPTFSNSIIAPSSSQPTSSFSYVTNAVSSMFMKRNDSATSLESRASPTVSTKDYSKFFEKTLPLHRILYHLEALSSKLMPSSSDTSAQQNAELFQQEFLKANGLETLTSMLKLENSLKSIDYEAKQDIYILLLQLLRLIFFGSYYPNETSIQINSNELNGVNKRPSTEPITTCAKKTILPSMVDTSSMSSQPQSFNKNANSFLDSNVIFTNSDSKTQSLVDKMSLTEVNEIIIQLLLIAWASAAGNLQFAHMNTSLTSLAESKSSRTLSNSSNSSLNGNKTKSSPFKSAQNLKEEQTNNNLDELKDDEINESMSGKKEVKFTLMNHRLSTGSNMSTSSMDSSDNSQQLNFSPLINTGQLQPGICIKQSTISNKDIKIALKAIEMVSCFLNYRKDSLSTLLEMKLFSECVIDVLTGSVSSKIREYMEKFLLKLCHIESPCKCKDYLINLVIKSRLPLWGNSSITRSPTQRLIKQSTQYFSLRSKLFKNMTSEEQTAYGIDLRKMLNDQLTWFLIFSPTKNLKDIDNILLAGHLGLTKSLLTCETANKAEFGSKIIPPLIRSYLFPAAFIISNPSEDSSMDPICSDEETRIAAYKLLVELSRNCYKNYELISKQLIDFHHSQNPSMSNEWNYIPLVTPRAECDYVGLKNGGATCYMNAILQQLFMMPGVPEYLLSIDQDEQEKISVFYQLQNVFAHLKESKLEYYIPESFWKAFRMWGQEVNIREQQDAYDFFISMTDQIDECLKKMHKEPIFKNILEGTFSNQFICTDCPHKYEREEAFLGLNLPIKSGNLEESLLQFVKDELLDGDNSYNCEKCNEKRSAIKRTCIKKLPKYLCIQLKRFDYDWETNRSLKFDDYFQFPRMLDVAPYMYESINKTRQSTSNLEKPNSTSLTDLDIGISKESASETKMDTNLSQSLPNHTFQFKKKMPPKNEMKKEVLYELVGIVVHSGQANAGHYYSFIKGLKNNQLNLQQELEELEERDRLIEEEENGLLSSDCEPVEAKKQDKIYYDFTNDKWYKFNDTSVEEINLNEATLIEECFGGIFTQTSEFKILPEERVRYWNGYMLFYREVSYNGLFQQDVLRNANNKLRQQRREQFTSKSKVSSDSLSELTELVSRGDEKGLFRTHLPSSIEQMVKSENLEFCKNRSVYDNDYFQFIYEMVKIAKDNYEELNKSSEHHLFIANSCNLGLEFLFNTYLKTGKKLRTDLTKWLDLFKEILPLSKEAAYAMLNFIVDHEANSNFIRHYLLECPISEIRDACAQLFDYFFNNLIIRFNIQPLNNSKITNLITSFVQLLDKAVIDLCKNSHEFFKVLLTYADLTKETTQQLISLSLFNKLLCFLLGNPGSAKSEEYSSSNRRWNTIQSREFAIVHELIATLVLKCNIFSIKTCEFTSETNENADISDEITRRSYQPPSNLDNLIPLPQEMQIYLIGALSNRYLKELIFAFEQINSSLLSKTLEMILGCCYCNELFSSNIINQILTHINSSSFNEIKQVLSLLNNIILIEDPLQLKRLQLALDGSKENDTVYNGLLSIVRQNQGSDAKKSYQCVKLIVTLANTSSSCKEYLLKTAPNWEWSVNWLKKKMLDSCNWNPSNKSNEDSESRTFQRTKSAQRTLEDATALLKSGSDFD